MSVHPKNQQLQSFFTHRKEDNFKISDLRFSLEKRKAWSWKPRIVIDSQYTHLVKSRPGHTHTHKHT